VVDAGAGNAQRSHEPERVCPAEVEPVQTLGDHDRVAPVDREVEVVGIVDGDRLAGATRSGQLVYVLALPCAGLVIVALEVAAHYV